MMKTFKERVREVVANIPKGQVMTYGEVGRRAGHPNAARAVGAIMKGNFDPNIPCHRVVGASSLGGYNRGVDLKRKRLQEEGYAGV